MKLKTKLAVCSILMTVLAVALSCAFTMTFALKNALADVTETGMQDYRTFYYAFLKAAGDELPEDPLVRRSYLVRAFRSVEGFSEFTLRQGETVLCSNAGFDVERLFPSAETSVGELTVQSRVVRALGTDYFVAHATCRIGSATYDLSLARDISGVTNDVRALTVQCAAAGLGVAAVAAIATWRLVSRAMRPVERLRAGASALAAGDYESRIALAGRDELAELAGDFNAMADAVQGNIEALRERSERQQTFINDLSHELKTPVTAILLSSETLLHRQVPPEAQTRALTRIFDQGRWLDQLSQKLMTLVLLQGTLDLQPGDVGALLAAVRETVGETLRERRITLTVDCRMDTLPMDFDLLRAALVNLVTNAVRASADGQTVALSAQDGTIAVADRGVGIPPEELARVTEPFYTVDRSRSKKHGGAGLGLALVHGIAEAHGARLEIESAVGRGTTARLVFPPKHRVHIRTRPKGHSSASEHAGGS